MEPQQKNSRLFIFFIVLLIGSILPLDGLSQEYRKVEIEHPLGQFRGQGMNNLGQICGNVLVDPDNFVFNAFIREVDGGFRTLSLGEEGVSATTVAINDHGHVLGTITKADFSSIEVVWDGENTYRELESLEGFISVFPEDLNNQGEAIGNTLTDPPQAYFWNDTGAIIPLPPGAGGQALALNNNRQIVGLVVQEIGGSLPVLWEPSNDTTLRNDIEFDLTFLQTFDEIVEESSYEATGINDNGFIVGSCSTAPDLLNAIFWNPSGIRNLTDEIIDDVDLNGRLIEINSFNYGIGSHQIPLGTGGPIVELGMFVDLNSEPPLIFFSNQLYTPGTTLPLFTDFNDLFQILGFDNLSVANFVVGMDPNALPNSGELGLTDFSSFDEASNQLDQFLGDPFQVPVIISIPPGVYVEDSWTIKPWSLNIDLRGEGEGTAQINQINIPSGVDATIQPRLGLTYDIKGINSAGGRLNFFGDAIVDSLELSGEEQAVSITNPAQFSLNKLKISGADVTVDQNLSVSELDLDGTLKGVKEDFEFTISNNGSSVYSIDQLLPGSGFVQVNDVQSGISGSFTHQIGGANYGPGDHFTFPIGLETEEGFKADLATLEYLTDQSWGDHSLTFQSITAPSLEEPNIQSENFVHETFSPRVFRVGVRLNWEFTDDDIFIRNQSETGIVTNFRIPAYDLDPTDDPNQYRLLKYDCSGNFIEIAGSFLPPTGEAPENVIYTGAIDSVLVISHQNVSLDTCNYFVLATGKISTSTLVAEHFLDFGLSNYPNPFSEFTNISYVLPEAAHVDLTLFTLASQRIGSLVNEFRQSGLHEVTLSKISELGDLSSGAYVLRITVKNSLSNAHHEQSRLVIVK